jgi:hypothetical protein
MDKKKKYERVSLYFNLENEDDKIMFRHMDNRKKSQYIKNLIMNDIKGHRFTSTGPDEIAVDEIDKADLEMDAMDFDE